MRILARMLGRRAGRNPALEHIKSLPGNETNWKLIAALPDLADALYSEARKAARQLDSLNSLLVECILDLELVGGFEKISGFTSDFELASIYVDAIVFQATDKNPSGVPSEVEFRISGTENYRGITKYSLASKFFNVADPVAWLFGKEYSKIKSGDANNFAYVAPTGPLSLTIRQNGAWITQLALTGTGPSQEEIDAFSAASARASKALEELIKSMREL